MPKIFPKTFDGDQISVSFEYSEEESAFRSVCSQIERVIQKNEVRETQIDDFQLKTTLEAEVAEQYFMFIKLIIGISVLNVTSKSKITIIPLPEES